MTETVYIVRKHIMDVHTGKEMRHEDYPRQFATPEAAQPLLEEKQVKFFQTVRDLIADCKMDPQITEWRRYEIVPIEVPT